MDATTDFAAAQRATTEATANNGPAASTVVGTDRLVLVFDYRSLIESEDVDMINYEAWKEVLDSFGYGDLTFPHFMRSLVLKSPSEVMTALCPYTTKAEWGPILNKRTTRLGKDISKLCYAEMLPLAGARDFIIDCTKKALVTCVFLSPFPDDVTRRMLELAEVGPYIDLVHSYSDREFALLEALEMINIRPRRIPDGIEHRWSDDDNRTITDAEGNTVKAPFGSDEVSRAQGVLNPAEVVVCTTDLYACERAAELGCKIIGLTYNGGFFGAEEPPVDATTAHASTSGEGHHGNENGSGETATASAPRAHATSPTRRRRGASAENPNNNNGTEEEGEGGSDDEQRPIATTRDNGASSIDAHADEYDRTNHEQCLLGRGAAVVVEDYSQLRYDYLAHLKAPPPPHAKAKREAA